jgi:hypothetical protein
MQQNREIIDNPLRHLTAAQFMALGGNAVVYVKQVKGEQLGDIITGSDFDAGEDFHIVVSADGSPLMVADSQEAVEEWLQGQPYGIVLLH